MSAAIRTVGDMKLVPQRVPDDWELFIHVKDAPPTRRVTPLDRFGLDPMWDYFHPSSASYPDMPPVTPTEGGPQLPVYNGGPLTPDSNLPPPGYSGGRGTGPGY
jgi:hypothetical protein